MATAQQQLDGFLEKYTPEIAKLGHQALAHMRKRLPGAVCQVYDNYSYLGVGFSPPTKLTKTPLSLVLYPRWVTLFFLKGASLSDPDGLLEGKGSQVRSIRLVDGMKTLKAPAVDTLIAEAVMQASWTLDARAAGEVVIRLISAKQRPRRP